MTVPADIASDTTFITAFARPREQRREYPDYTEVWGFVCDWSRERDRALAEVQSISYSTAACCCRRRDQRGTLWGPLFAGPLPDR